MLPRLLPATLAALLASVAASHAATLTLRFTGAEAKGTVLVALFSTERGYKGDRPVATARARASGGTATVALDGLEQGTYAVKAFQDTDGNGRLSTNALGIPREPYAFSNNARGRFGPPGWKSAAFALGASGARQTIALE